LILTTEMQQGEFCIVWGVKIMNENLSYVTTLQNFKSFYNGFDNGTLIKCKIICWTHLNIQDDGMEQQTKIVQNKAPHLLTGNRI